MTRNVWPGLVALAAAACSREPTVATANLKVVVHEGDPQTVVLEWTGPIDSPMADLFQAEFKRRKRDAKTFVIDLHSPGGSVVEGERVIKSISEMTPTHSIRTFVGPGNECSSMCVPIYLQGELRIAASSSQFMFHEPYAVDPVTGQEAFQYEFEKRQSSMDIFGRYYRSSEIDKQWLEAMRAKARHGEVWKTGQELKDERSKIVSVIADKF